MDKKIAGLLGEVAAVASMDAAQAATGTRKRRRKRCARPHMRDLLTPIPNAVALLDADDAARSQRPAAEGADGVQVAQYHHHHHHHHHRRIDRDSPASPSSPSPLPPPPSPSSPPQSVHGSSTPRMHRNGALGSGPGERPGPFSIGGPVWPIGLSLSLRGGCGDRCRRIPCLSTRSTRFLLIVIRGWREYVDRAFRVLPLLFVHLHQLEVRLGRYEDHLHERLVGPEYMGVSFGRRLEHYERNHRPPIGAQAGPGRRAARRRWDRCSIADAARFARPCLRRPARSSSS